MRVLLVSRSPKATETLRSLVGACERGAFVADSHGEADARRRLMDEDWDLVVIDTPLEASDGTALARMVVERTEASPVLLASMDAMEDLAERTEDLGVLLEEKPLITEVFRQTLRLAVIMQKRLRSIRNENLNLQSKIEEIRLVDKAKWALMRHQGLSEPEAHRYIEKRAMDGRTTRSVVARAVLRTYEEP